MRQFAIRGATIAISTLEVLSEIENGFMVRIHKEFDGYEDVCDEFMSHELFATCLRTGYLAELSA